MTSSLEGRRAVVTGASSGVGKAVATMLLERGARVVCVGRRMEALAEFERVFGAQATALSADFSSKHDVSHLVGEIAARFQRLDILVNNAGHNDGGSVAFGACPDSDWRDVLAVNLTALMQLTHGLMPLLRSQTHAGHVVNIGSIISRLSAPNMAAYITSKHGVHGFSEALRTDYEDGSLRVTEILPGTVKTGFAERRWGGEEDANAFYERIPILLSSDDIARSVVWALEQPAELTICEIVMMPSRRR
jgi:3-hydroxy acid dehydrogenase / malonic semialdehyde reductase